MGLRATLEKSHAILDSAEIDHALIGGFALAVLGIHRATHDIDYLIDGSKAEEAKNAFSLAGWEIRFQSSEVLQLKGLGLVVLLFAKRPLSIAMLTDGIKLTSQSIKCVSPESLIALKIQAYKNDSERELQDKADIKKLIQKYPQMDWDKLKQYAELFSEWKFIQQCKKQ